MAAVLQFFSEVSSEPLMKDWLGGAEGNIFWPAILTMLCNTPVQATTIRKNSNHRIEVCTHNQNLIFVLFCRYFIAMYNIQGDWKTIQVLSHKKKNLIKNFSSKLFGLQTSFF